MMAEFAQGKRDAPASCPHPDSVEPASTSGRGHADASASAVARSAKMPAPVPAFVHANWFRTLQLQLMTTLFAHALEADPPVTRGMGADELLYTFAQFSATEAAAALSEEDGGARKMGQLGAAARRMGRRLRAMPMLHGADPSALVAALYRNIRIELRGSVPGKPCMGPCYFSNYYTPRICAFMRAFDEGIMSGIAGDGTLDFATRITEGAPECRACFTLKDKPRDNRAS